VICWMDFEMDSILGPVLREATADAADRSGPIYVCRSKQRQLERTACIKEDARGALIQEARRGYQPARMVGSSDLGSNSATTPIRQEVKGGVQPRSDMDVGRGARAQLARQGGEA
jgi:hypothetical protein